MTAESTCRERVHRDWGASTTCGRPVKEDGLCGIHLRAKRERARRDAERAEKREQQKALRSETAALIAELNELGIAARENYDYHAGIDGRVIVDPKQLLRALRGESS